MQLIHVIILAAGQGTRMKSARPKVLHEIGGRPMLGHVLDAARAAGASVCHVVHGHGAAAVRQWHDDAHAGTRDGPKVNWVLQAQQLGTAHAVLQALPKIPDDAIVLVLYGDVPLVAVETLTALIGAAARGLALLTVELNTPQGYGRILRNAAGQVTGIVEDNDASARQKKITEVNTGLLAAPAKQLKQWLAKVGNDNAKKEFYLTDIVALAARGKGKGKAGVASVAAPDAQEVEGVNDRVQLARAERVYQARQAARLLREGVGLADPARFDLRGILLAGKDVQLDVGVIVEGVCELGDGVRIGPYCLLKNVKLGANTVVESHSVLDGATTGVGAHIGPFARLRPGTTLADGARVGNFVETKQATIGRNSKVNHLSYIGDATLGANVNVGAGTITCNYDGANKHRTVIEDGAFIGSNTALVAPVTIGASATIGAGSTIAKAAPADALTLTRAEQRTLTGWKRPSKNNQGKK